MMIWIWCIGIRTRFISDKKAVFGPKYGVDSPLYEHHTTSLVFNDPPCTPVCAKVMVGAMNPRALAQMEPGLIQLVDGLLDQMQAKGSVELIEDFAGAIPIEIIGNLLGIPRSERGPAAGLVFGHSRRIGAQIDARAGRMGQPRGV